MNKWKMTIGLEIHVQLKTRSKLFSASSIAYGQKQNTQASWLDIGLPGTLPMVNKKAIEYAIIFGLATNATISRNSFFARKNYFYPDLPKGYQISQSNNPIVQEGHLDIVTSEGSKTIKIERAHLEDDAGKSNHDFDHTKIDYNRAGTPLLEVVTYPDFNSAEEVTVFLKQLHQLVMHLGICDGNMQEGSFRCDVNLSVNKKDSQTLGVRTEMKNINSFKFIEQAIAYEFYRQVALLEKGEKITQETRLYDTDKNETRSMRNKENAFDYRYFPDPDLLPIYINDSYIKHIQSTMPMTAQQKKENYARALNKDAVDFLLSNPKEACFYDELCKKVDKNIAYNWLSDMLGILRKKRAALTEIPSAILIEIIQNVIKEEVSTSSGKQLIQYYLDERLSINELVEKHNLKQASNIDEVKAICKTLIASHQQQFEELKSGNTKLMGFFVGQIMKKGKGRFNPKEVNSVLHGFINQQ